MLPNHFIGQVIINRILVENLWDTGGSGSVSDRDTANLLHLKIKVA